MAHLIGDRLIPERSLLWVDRGILHVGPTKSLTFSPGFSLKVAMGEWSAKSVVFFFEMNSDRVKIEKINCFGEGWWLYVYIYIICLI